MQVTYSIDEQKQLIFYRFYYNCFPHNNFTFPEYPLEAGEYDYEESEYLDEDLDDENDDQQYEGGSDGYYGDQYGKHPGEGRPRSQERRMVNRSHDQRDQSPDLTTGEESEDTLQDNYRMGEDRLRQVEL